jgi:eukaryotic-like serine/threonine-protein kinase
MINRVGQRLGNYQLTHLLGSGGFADVYLGQHVFLKTQAAIKVMHMRLTEDSLISFLNEARLIASLVHPHIVRVLDFGIEGNEPLVEASKFEGEGSTPFLVMDYAPNGSSRKHFPKGTRVPIETIIFYIKQIASALQYAHDKKLIHRDIKPENILLGSNNDILLSDFGLALVSQTSLMLSTQEVIGTAAYMAPEQFEGKPRRASDQYALGIIVYEWLCGDRPFHGTFTELCSQHLVILPPSLREKNSEIPPALERVVMIALAKNPQQRFASVSAFANALEQAYRADLTPLYHSNYSFQPSSGQILPTLPGNTPSNLPTLSKEPPPISMQSILPTPQFSISPVSEGNFISMPMSSESARNVTHTLSVSDQVRPPVLQAEEVQPKRAISRRAVLVGFGAAGLAVIGGGIAWEALSHKPTIITQTQIPLGARLVTYLGHTKPVYGLKWAPSSTTSGSRIASVGADKTIQVWDATTGKTIVTYRGHSQATTGAAWLPHLGTRIASSSSDTSVQVWDAATGKTFITYKGHTDNVRNVTWSPDGMHIASGGDDKTVQVWNAATGAYTFTYRGHSKFIWYIRWSPDGTRIVSASDDTTAQVWDAATGAHIFTFKGHSKGVKAVAWSPDSKRIASVSDDTTVQVWDAATGDHALIYRGHSNALQGVAWSPNGKRIASSSEDVHVWDAESGNHVFIYHGHSAIVHGVDWSPDGTRLGSASDDDTVQVWQAV